MIFRQICTWQEKCSAQQAEPAVEYHYNIFSNGGIVNRLYVCEKCASHSRWYDKTCNLHGAYVVLPEIGSDESIAVEVFMDALCRLLRACAGWEPGRTAT